MTVPYYYYLNIDYCSAWFATIGLPYLTRLHRKFQPVTVDGECIVTTRWQNYIVYTLLARLRGPLDLYTQVLILDGGENRMDYCWKIFFD